MGFPGGAVVENLPANAGDTCSSPGLGTKIPHAAAWQGQIYIYIHILEIQPSQMTHQKSKLVSIMGLKMRGKKD